MIAYAYPVTDVRVGRSGDGFHQTAPHQAGIPPHLRAHSHPGGALPYGLVMIDFSSRESVRAFYESWAWKKLRYQVLRKYGPKCMCCGSTNRVTVDHIIPVRECPEKRLDFNNLQVLCQDCNQGKSYRDQTDWRPESRKKRESAVVDSPADITLNPEASVQFLARKSGTGRSHVWSDRDTLCHMASTGGLNPRRYKLVDHNPGLPVCTMCRRIAQHQGFTLD